MKTFELRAQFSRRLPDPILSGVERHVLLCAVEDIPDGLPLEGSNVRNQNIDKRIYRDVAKHLRNEEGTKNTFHLKNKGITLLANDVAKKDDDSFILSFARDTHGIVDGGHTYRIILENKKKILRVNAAAASNDERIRQFVKVEILTGLEDAIGNEMARGLNTAVQVQEMALANHAKKFDWVKADLAGEPYFTKIAFRQNDDGLLDVADLLRTLELFNISLYPNDNSKASHPTRAYTGKENVLASYLKDDAPLLKLRPILKDILILHDTISIEAPELWNTGRAGKAGQLAFVDHSKAEPYDFPFINRTAKSRLYRGALFPMIAAFRWMVVEDSETGSARWRSTFADVLLFWRRMAVKLMEATKETSEELGRSPDAIGKSSNHWKNLYNEVAREHMQQQMWGPGKTSP